MFRRSGLVVATVVLLVVPLTSTRAESAEDNSDAPAVAENLGISVAAAASRLSEPAAVYPAIEFVKSHPADFGGIYFDSDGVLTIALARGGTGDRDAASRLIPQATIVHWLTVEHSMSDLALVRDELVDRIRNSNGTVRPSRQ